MGVRFSWKNHSRDQKARSYISCVHPAFFTKKLEEIQAEAQARYLEERHHWCEEGLDMSTEVDPNVVAKHMLQQAQGEADEPKPDAPEPFPVEGFDGEEEEAAAAWPKLSKGKGTGGSKGKGKMSKAAIEAMKNKRGKDSSDSPSEGHAEPGAASTSRGMVRRHTPSKMTVLVDHAKDDMESVQQKLSEAAHVQVKAKEHKETIVSGFKAMDQRVKEAEEAQDALLAYVLQMNEIIRAERTLDKSFITSTRKRKLSSSEAKAEEESRRRRVHVKREVPATKTKLKKSATVESEALTPPWPQATLKCHKCPVTFRVEKALKMHLKEKHSKKKLEHACLTCRKAFLYKLRLLEHLPKHSQELNFPCDFCDKAFKTQQARGQHVRIAHKEFEYCCPVCQQIFQFRATLNHHTKNQHGELRLECDICGWCFRAQHAFTSHKCPMQEEEQQEEEQEPQEGNTILKMRFPDEESGSDYKPSSPAASSDSASIDPAEWGAGGAASPHQGGRGSCQGRISQNGDYRKQRWTEWPMRRHAWQWWWQSDWGGNMPGHVQADEPSTDQDDQEPEEPIDSSAIEEEDLDRT